MTLTSDIQNATTNNPSPSTAGWNFSPRRFTVPYKACLLAGTALVAAVLAGGIAAGAFGLLSVAEAAVAATGVWYGIRHMNVVDERKVTEASSPADGNTRAMVDMLLRRADATPRPVNVRTVEGEFAAIAGNYERPDLFVGRKLAEQPAAQCGVVAHELGHMKGHPHKFFEEVLAPANKAAGLGLVVASLGLGIVSNPMVGEMMRFSLSATFAAYVLANIAQKFEENRADRNAMALFPHPTALHDYLRDSAPASDGVHKMLNRIFDDHTESSKRLSLMEKFSVEAAAFFGRPKVGAQPAVATPAPS